jgi:hypothetical protein
VLTTDLRINSQTTRPVASVSSKNAGTDPCPQSPTKDLINGSASLKLTQHIKGLKLAEDSESRVPTTVERHPNEESKQTARVSPEPARTNPCRPSAWYHSKRRQSSLITRPFPIMEANLSYEEDELHEAIRRDIAITPVLNKSISQILTQAVTLLHQVCDDWGTTSLIVNEYMELQKKWTETIQSLADPTDDSIFDSLLLMGGHLKLHDPSSKRPAPSASAKYQAPRTKLQAPSSEVQASSPTIHAVSSKPQAPRSPLYAPSSRLQAPSSKLQAPSSKLQAPSSSSKLQATESTGKDKIPNRGSMEKYTYIPLGLH